MSARLANWLTSPRRGGTRMRPALLGALTATNLIHTCLIGRRAQEVDEDDGDAPVFDAYEEPVMGDYAPTLAPPVTATGSRTPCFAWLPIARGEVAQPGSAYVAHRWHLLLPVGTAIAEDDAIGDVQDEDGAALVAGPLNVAEVATRRGHLLAIADVATTGLEVS